MSYWVSPQAVSCTFLRSEAYQQCTTFSFDYALDGAEWVTLEKYILDYMLQEGRECRGCAAPTHNPVMTMQGLSESLTMNAH